MQNAIPHMQQDDGSIPPSLQNYSGNRFPDMMPMETNHPVDQSFQVRTIYTKLTPKLSQS